MATTVKDFYIIQHSHMDVGYTDLQERVIYNQVSYIKRAIQIIKNGYLTDTLDKGFKWCCESYFCIEKFLQDSTEQEQNDFFEYVKKGNIGISATYLNFNDLVDAKVLNKRTIEMKKVFADRGIDLNSAMIADINGVHMGARDIFINNGVDFFLTTIHTHHGMYPLKANQNAFYWENETGKKLLVYNAEKYLLANDLGFVFNINVDRVDYPNVNDEDRQQEHLKRFKGNIDRLVQTYEKNGYKEDFFLGTTSGKYSDNAPPYVDIMSKIEIFNKTYSDIQIHLITIEEFGKIVKERVNDIPTYKGDLNDWWAHGINSTPYLVKHYKEATRMYDLCTRLNPNGEVDVTDCMRVAEDNLMLYAEHTWGHSSTITNPYDTMVLNLDVRKNSYASKAHEASAMALNKIQHALGDKLEYYDLDGKVKVINTSNTSGKKVVSFYLEFYIPDLSPIKIKVVEQETGKDMSIQISGHPRGKLITFVDEFKANETKIYAFNQAYLDVKQDNSNQAYVGAERVKDIISEYSDTYDLQHKIENDYFRIAYDVRDGVTSFYNKKDDIEMLNQGDCKFFTPVYEVTEIKTNTYEERRLLGRNIRGIHAKLDFAKLQDIKVLDHGEVFTTIELEFELKGTTHCSTVIKMYHQLPKIDFKYKFAKTIESSVENLFVPIGLNVDKEISFNKGGVKMRPAIDQIPYTNNEYYAVDCGIMYGDNILLKSYDVPMVYAGELKHHAIKLCDNDAKDNQRDLYSWVMNNIWETNFKMDLSGFCEFCYSIELTDTIKTADELTENCVDVLSFIVE